MMTDWLIVRRLAAELDRAARGARVREAGLLDDGRFAMRLPRATLAIDAFGATPILTYEDGAVSVRDVPGWSRALAKTLEGMKIDRIRARRGDRLIAIECSAQSRFGVATSYRLVCELVPRFGNVVLLKDDTIVAAAKEFTPNGRASRTIVAGETYEAPPLPSGELADGEARERVRRALAERESAALAKALRAAVPLLPQLVAMSYAVETLEVAHAATNGADALAERSIARARELVTSAQGESAGTGDIFVYRDGDEVTQFHIVPLRQFDAMRVERTSAILPLCNAVVGGARRSADDRAFADRLASLRARVVKRTTSLESERRALERERDDATSRDALRRAGDLLYAHLAEIPARASAFVPPSEPGLTIALDPELDAKANAAAIFKRYRKATTKLEHLERRLNEIARDLELGADVAWELERADVQTLAETIEGVERFERKRTLRAHTAKVETRARRKPLEVALAGDARAYVGRSPRENADVTFRIGRPDDLWFHARGIPSAHVVLHIDTARAASADEIEIAASLAAYHSRARASDRVEVDYTERKYVRKQQGGAPGQVWYTNARTVSVRPRERGLEAQPVSRSSA